MKKIRDVPNNVPPFIWRHGEVELKHLFKDVTTITEPNKLGNYLCTLLHVPWVVRISP